MKVSLIIPCYNEINNINKGVLTEISDYVKDLDLIQEVIIVDDGSSDGSDVEIEQKFIKNNPKIRLVRANHGGKASAVTLGVKNALASHILFMDFDLATPLVEIKHLVDNLLANNGDIAIGSRGASRSGAPLLRKIMAWGMIMLRTLITGVRLLDTQCGFKLYQRDKFLDLSSRLQVFGGKSGRKGPSVSAGWDVEMLFLARKLGMKVIEVPVVWHHKDTKRVNFLRDSFEGLSSLVHIRFCALLGKYNYNR